MSMSRHCSIEHCKDGKWYVFLAGREYGGYEDSTCYGPFPSYALAEDYVCNGPHCNPGALTGGPDDPPMHKTPTRSPNGGGIQCPVKSYGCW
jgi:hypothetical protein